VTLLKQWLDAHLPGLVERLMGVKIERVVDRMLFIPMAYQELTMALRW
jgi:hypothetical protein